MKMPINSRLPATLLLAVAMAVCFTGASGKKKPEATVRFHTEAAEEDTKTFAMPVDFEYAGKSGYVSKVATLSERDITQYYPFRASDGSWGASFYLNAHGRIMLDSTSIERRGQYMLAVVNARQVLDMLIDKRIPDGIITVPFGLTDADIALLDKEFPRAGGGGETAE